MNSPAAHIRQLEEENAKLRRRVNLLEKRLAVFQETYQRIAELANLQNEYPPNKEQ